jgi:hypothetical protein
MRRASRLRSLCALALFALGPGCATMVHGSDQMVHFECKPEGVLLRDLESGETWNLPADVRLWRRRHHKLVATLDGYKPQQIYLTREVGVRWYFLDAFTAGIGFIVDASTGALYELGPDPVVVVLEPESSAPSPARAP